MIKLNRPDCPNRTALRRGNYKHPANKAALINASHGKCMYCESKFNHIDYGDVEHYRPKSKYPDLEFDWENLGIACVICNRKYKKDQFDETTPYVDPYIEDPEDHIVAHGSWLMHKQGSERGQITIDDIGLNRAELMEKRSCKLKEIITAINDCMRTSNAALKQRALDELLKLHQADQEFSLVTRSIFRVQGLLA